MSSSSSVVATAVAPLRHRPLIAASESHPRKRSTAARVPRCTRVAPATISAQKEEAGPPAAGGADQAAAVAVVVGRVLQCNRTGAAAAAAAVADAGDTPSAAAVPKAADDRTRERSTHRARRQTVAAPPWPV
eukprot:5662110-Prymnesium_polylepis.2